MSTFSQKLFLQTRPPILQFQRYRGKINIQRPKAPHYERARVIAATKPIFPKTEISHRCHKKKESTALDRIINPYNEIIAKEVLNWFRHSKMTCVFQVNSIIADDLFKVKVALHKQNMHMKTYGKDVVGLALNNTKYEAIMPLFAAHYYLVFGMEENIKQLIKITKRVPQMIMLGGIIEDTLMSRNELIDFAKLPDLQTTRSQFVNVLNMAGGQLVNDLEGHQKSFVNILDVYAKSDETTNQNPTDQPDS